MSDYTPLSEENKQAIKVAIKLKGPDEARSFITSFLGTGKDIEGFDKSADFIFACNLLDDVADLYIAKDNAYQARETLQIKLFHLPESATEERLNTCQKLDAVADLYITQGHANEARETLTLKLSNLPDSATEERLNTCQQFDAVADLYIAKGNAYQAYKTLKEKLSRLSENDIAEEEKTQKKLQQFENYVLQYMVKNFLVDTQTAPSQKLVP